MINENYGKNTFVEKCGCIYYKKCHIHIKSEFIKHIETEGIFAYTINDDKIHDIINLVYDNNYNILEIVVCSFIKSGNVLYKNEIYGCKIFMNRHDFLKMTREHMDIGMYSSTVYDLNNIFFMGIKVREHNKGR
jgi:hypothetical protein